MKKNCFIILGMHRSGTSATTGMLSYFDISLGSALIKPNEENPKGFFENKAVLDLNKKILSTYNSDWDDYHFKLKDIEPSQMKSWVSEAQIILENEFSNRENFAIKDPRLCLLFPIWEEALKNFNTDIKIIIVNRHPSAVAASLKTRNGFRKQKSILLWAKYTLSIESSSRKHDRLLIQYPASFLETAELISKLKTFTGLSISDTQLQKALEFYDNSLTRHQVIQEDLTKDTPPLLVRFLSLLESGDISQSSLFDSIQKELDLMINFFSDKQTIHEKNKQLSSKSTQIRQRNERITRLYADIDDIENAISHRIVNYENEIAKLTKKLAETEQEALQFSNRTAELAETYLRDRVSNAWIKGLYKHKKDKRLMQKINRLQLRLRKKMREINSPDNDIDEQK